MSVLNHLRGLFVDVCIFRSVVVDWALLMDEVAHVDTSGAGLLLKEVNELLEVVV